MEWSKTMPNLDISSASLGKAWSLLFYINMSNALRLTSFDANIILANQIEAARGIKTEQRFTFSHSVGGTSKFTVRQKCSDFTISQNGR